MRIIDEAWLEDSLDREIRRGLVQCFPRDHEVFSQTRAWHGSAPGFSVVIERDERVIAHVGIVQRIVTVDDHPFKIAGVQNVFVLPEHRGQGLIGRVMEAAMDEARRRGGDGGLLFCGAGLEKLYHRLGWRKIDVPVTRILETGAQALLPDKNAAMVFPLNRPWPAGPIHLRGNDW